MVFSIFIGIAHGHQKVIPSSSPKSIKRKANVCLIVQQNETDLDISDWQIHPNGTIHLGEDGVLRSLDDHKIVLNYTQLGPHQLDHLISAFFNHTYYMEHFKGVDGLSVTDPKKLTEPEPHLLSRQVEPPPSIHPRAVDPGANTPQWCNRLGCGNNWLCNRVGCGPCFTLGSVGRCYQPPYCGIPNYTC